MALEAAAGHAPSVPPSVPGATRVLIVDDHPAVREGLRAMLVGEDGLEPVAAVATAAKALEVAGEARPDLVLLDYHLPDEDGLSLALRLGTSASPPRTLIYSAFADEMLALLAAVAGAHGLVSKAALSDELSDAIRAVASGETRLPALTPAVMEATASGLRTEDLPVVGMLLHGTPAAEIAVTLDVSEDWLIARRWAILRRLRRRPSRIDGTGHAARPIP